MPVFSVYVFQRSPTGQSAFILSSVVDVSSFSFLYRSSVGEFLLFSSRTLAQKTPAGGQHAVEHKDYMGLSRTVGALSVVVMTDLQYPQRTGWVLVQKVMAAFMEQQAARLSVPLQADTPMPLPKLGELFRQFQDPVTADPMSRVQARVAETTEIMRVNLEQMLERGEKLDTLVAKSSDLTERSKNFYKTAKKMNCRCVLL